MGCSAGSSLERFGRDSPCPGRPRAASRGDCGLVDRSRRRQPCYGGSRGPTNGSIAGVHHTARRSRHQVDQRLPFGRDQARECSRDPDEVVLPRHALRCAKIAFTLAKMAFSLAAWWFGAPRALCAASALSGFEVARDRERSLRASALTGLANMQYSKGKSPGLSGQDDRPVVTGGLRSADSKRAHLQPGRLVRQGRRREPDLLHHRRRSGLRPRAVPVIESSARTSRCGTGRRATSISTAAK